MNSSTISVSNSPRSTTPSRKPVAPSPKNSTSSPQLSIQVARWGEAPAEPSPDPELTQLRAQIEDLETKLALYRRREQLELEYLNLERRDGCMPIIRLVAREFIIPIEQLLSGSKLATIAFARQVAMTLCRERTGLSFHELGRVFSKRDHSAVINALRAVRDRCETDPSIAARLAKLRAALTSTS